MGRGRRQLENRIEQQNGVKRLRSCIVLFLHRMSLPVNVVQQLTFNSIALLEQRMNCLTPPPPDATLSCTPN